MAKFKEKTTGRVWTITNVEHLKHFCTNPRFEEIEKIKENKKVKTSKKEEENIEK